MSAQNPNLRDALNDSSQLQRLADVFRGLGLGDLLGLLIRGLTATETGVVPSSNVAVLANVPVHIFQVNVTAGTLTGVKTLRIGKISIVVPAAGECVWEPGTKNVAFAAADAATAVSFTYSQGTEATSVLPRLVGEIDPL
jgi:hypothetical protein